MPVHLVERGLVALFFCTLCAIASTVWSDEVPRRVLLIQDAASEGSEFLAESLRQHQLSVDVQPSDRLFNSLDDLKPYASVILVDVPRDGEGGHFTDEQIRLLMQNTQQEGCGLVLIGGPNSFGPGGWANTELEEASPVRFASPLELSGGLVLVVDGSQAPMSTHYQRLAAREAMKPLGTQDRFDLIYSDSDGTAKWLDGEGDGIPPLGDRRANLLQRVDRIAPGEIASFDDVLGMVIRRFKATAATVKHVVILSDGSPKPPSDQTIQLLRQNRVTVSTIAIGTADSDALRRIASRTGGLHYVVKNDVVLPPLCRREARSVLRPHVFDAPDLLQVKMVTPHAITAGVGDKLPPISGLTLTTAKKEDDVELILTASTTKHDFPLLAVREYGKGRIAALTTDAGARWARPWTSPEHRDTAAKFLYRLTMWSAGIDELQD